MNTTNYKLEKGDTVRVTGCHGRLFSGSGVERELANGVELGVECILLAGEDAELDIQLPKGILADGKQFIHMSCAKLVKKGEYRSAVITHDPNCKIFEDETQNELVRVLHNATEYRLDPAYLELVDPVEELEPCEAEAFSPANDIKSANNAQKYDPCRKFRKGDKVRIVQCKGRHFDTDTARHVHDIVTVVDDEAELDPDALIPVHDGKERFFSDPAYLELVTPVEGLEPYSVEELEPYSVKDSSDRYMVVDEKGAVIVMFYKARHPHAKAAAEAECARLNEEYRKEQNNA